MSEEGLGSLRQVQRTVERIVIVAVLGTFVAIALPWFFRIAEIELRAPAIVLLGFAIAYLGIVIVSDRVRSTRALSRTTYATLVISVVFIAGLWYSAGAAQNPVLLIAMTLPLIAAGAGRRTALLFDVALYSVAAVAVTMLLTAPDLIWYLVQLGVPLGRLAVALPQSASREVFQGTQISPPAALAIFATFALGELAFAWCLSSLLRVLRNRPSRVTKGATTLPDSLSDAALSAISVPAVLVLADTGQIFRTSTTFRQQMLLHEESTPAGELTAIIEFVDPESVREAIACGDSIPFCQYRVGAESRISTLRVAAFSHGAVRYAHVMFLDWSADAYLSAAAEDVQDPILVIGLDRRLRYANRAAAVLLGEHSYVGRNVQELLAPGGDPGWWESMGSENRRVQIAERSFEASSRTVRLGGSESGSLIVLASAEHS